MLPKKLNAPLVRTVENIFVAGGGTILLIDHQSYYFVDCLLWPFSVTSLCCQCCPAYGVLSSFATSSPSQTTSSWSVVLIVSPLDEETIKTPIPKCRLYWCFCLGWCSNFVDSESDQNQNDKLLQNMFYNTTQHPPPATATHCLYILIYCAFTLGRGGGVWEVREEIEGQQFTRGENTNMTDYISTQVYKLY
jgi:hypothetical protein